jgi:hypothetical protein
MGLAGFLDRLFCPRTAPPAFVCGKTYAGNPTAHALERKPIHDMATATTIDTSLNTGQQVSPRGLHRENQQPVTQQERNAAQRLRTTMAAVTLSFTWLGVRKTLAAR